MLKVVTTKNFFKVLIVTKLKPILTSTICSVNIQSVDDIVASKKRKFGQQKVDQMSGKFEIKNFPVFAIANNPFQN